MDQSTKERWLRMALILFGAIFILVYPISLVWPSGWVWGGSYSHYFPMILGVYATLGVFLLIASRDAKAHASLIAFTAWSSLVHALIMGAQASQDPVEIGHYFGDVPALILVFLVLWILRPQERAT